MSEAASDDSKRDEVRKQVEKDIEKAQDFKIIDSDIEKARKLIGLDVARGGKDMTWVGPATPNAIKRFAYSVGDDNPLYFDPNYGPGTPGHSLKEPRARRPDGPGPPQGAPQPVPRNPRLRRRGG